MFEHLDDKTPPQPRQLLVELVVAEGARRRRRRVVAAASVAATLLVVTSGVSLAQMGSTPKNLTVTEQPDTEQPDNPDRTDQTDVGPTTTVVGTPEGEATPGPSSGEGGEGAAPPAATPFAGITADGQVVLGDAATGAPTRVLVPTPTDGSQVNAGGVALAPDAKDVYYTRTEQDEDGEYEYSVMRVSTSGGTPERISRGTRPAISPDGTTLAYVRGSTQLVLRDIDTGHEQAFRGLLPGYRLQDLSFAVTDDRTYLLYTAAAGDEAPAELFKLDLLTVAAIASLSDAARLGPPAPPAVEEGTGWYAPDVRADGRISVVEQCCALDANSYSSAASVASVDVATGDSEPVADLEGQATVLRAPYDHAGQTQLVLSVEDDRTYVLERRSDSGTERLDQAPAYVAVDW
jgi:hypothetical protein